MGDAPRAAPGRLAVVVLLASLLKSFALTSGVSNATGGSPAKATAVATPHAAPTVAVVGGRERFAGLQRGVPKPDSRFGDRALTKRELEPIRSVGCLHDKQRNPHQPCEDKKVLTYSTEALSIGHYPHWTNPVCRNNGEFFCDPTNMLSPAGQQKATESLSVLRQRTLVNCGQLESILDPDAERRSYEKKHPVFSGRLGLEDYHEFNLAVVLADEWPSTERDPLSMQRFGWWLMSRWGLQPIYNGVDNGNPVNQYRETWHDYHANCPTTAVLIILPKYRDAYIASPSCEFICETRGGPEVIAATLAALDRGGPEAAILAGIDQVGKVLKTTIPLSIHKDPAPWNQAKLRGVPSDVALVWTLRCLYALLIFVFVFSVGAFLYFTFTPEQKQRRARESRHLLASNLNDPWVRESIRDEY